ncbi:MAG TPA: hypothetical protein VM029_16835 [Opitutaceae bacterium]|nr:hypothetical protein [Opitutaceae bacterium]
MKADAPSKASSSRPAHVLRTAFGFAAMTWMLAGCGSYTNVKVDSLAKPDAGASISYEIKNKNPLVAEDSLRYKEAAGFVKTALSGKGMYEAPPGAKPDLVVDLDYGVGPPVSRRETISEPVYITVPGQIRTERVQVGTDSQGRPIYQTVTVQDPPTTEFAGYREYQITVTVYEKFLKLAAHENKEQTEGRPAQEVWTVDVTSEGENRDIRKTLPVLVAASIEYIGKDSHGQKSIRIKDGDKDVAFVKKGM